MKCQALVERITGHSNVAGLRRGARMVHTEYGPCKFTAIAKLGELHLCTLHTRLTLEGLVDEHGVVADRGSMRDVRRYPRKFPNGLYGWAKGKEPVALDPPPSPPRKKDVAHG